MLRRVILLAVLVTTIATPIADAKPPSILYALDAPHARVTDAHHLRLPASARVTWFADRPQRSSGTTSLRTLQRLWDASGFAADPPNAALILTERGQTRMHVVELSHPRYRDRHVVFRIRRVPGAVEAGRADRDPIMIGGYRRAALFIDDAAAPPCPEALVVTGTGSCLLMDETPFQITVRAQSGLAHVVMCSSDSSAGGVVSFNGRPLVTSPCGQFSDANFIFGPPNGTAVEDFTYFALDGEAPITVQYALTFPAWAANAGS